MVQRGLADSRNQAQAMIMSGNVMLGDHRADKAGMAVADDAPITLKHTSPYVSRAGEKLASVTERFKFDPAGLVILDVGSSTGGFTDYCLQNGAARVYAVDVGTNQLAYKLRQDLRVVVVERTDIRSAKLPEQPNCAVIDVSFISLTKIIEAVSQLIKPEGLIIAMAKPQFEAGKTIADKFHGVIDDELVRAEILANLRGWLDERFEILDEADSGLKGAQGNLEHFYLLRPRIKH